MSSLCCEYSCVCSWKWQMSLSWSRQLFKCLSLFHRIGQSDSGLSLLLHIHIYIHTHTHTQSVHSHFCFNSLVSIVKVASVLLLLLFLSVPCASHYFIRWRTIRAENFIRWFFAFYSIPTKDFDKRTRKNTVRKQRRKKKKHTHTYTYQIGELLLWIYSIYECESVWRWLLSGTSLVKVISQGEKRNGTVWYWTEKTTTPKSQKYVFRCDRCVCTIQLPR